MELHDHLYALGLRMGREVFDDADGFRGALDDFLDEDAATTGDINLLVDAVRLGAFRSMTTLLDGGADVRAAIEEAGGRLARDRGSVDVAGAQWACAVLGFAVGRVADPDVRRYRSQHPVDPGMAATILPSTPQPPAQPPVPPQQPGAPGGPGGFGPPPSSPFTAQPGQPGQPPAAQPYSAPQQQFQSSSFPAPGAPGGLGGQQSWPAAQPPKKKRWPIVVAIVAVLALVGGGIGYVVANSGDDDKKQAAGETDGPTTDGPTTDDPVTSDPPTPDPDGTDFAAVNTRYSGLGAMVTTGVDSCAASGSQSGVSERLECTFANGVLELVTYDTPSELTAARKRAINRTSGGVYEKSASGILMGFEDKDSDGNAKSAYLYWDNNASSQSAKYVGDPAVDLDDLVSVFNSTDPSIAYPTGPSSPELLAFAGDWFKTPKCRRIETLVNGEIEENYCDVNGPIEVYLGQFETRKDFNSYRRLTRQNALADGRKDPKTWSYTGGDVEGTLSEYTTDSGSAVRYWDQPDCLCYAEAYDRSGNFTRLKNWWAR